MSHNFSGSSNFCISFSLKKIYKWWCDLCRFFKHVPLHLEKMTSRLEHFGSTTRPRLRSSTFYLYQRIAGPAIGMLHLHIMWIIFWLIDQPQVKMTGRLLKGVWCLAILTVVHNSDPLWFHLMKTTQPLQNGLPWSFAETFTVPRGFILMNFMIPWLFLCHVKGQSFHLSSDGLAQNIHGSRRINPHDFAGPLNFPLLPPRGSHLGWTAMKLG